MKSLVTLIALAFCGTLFSASSKSMIMRGGQGFLFPDNNSFQNPGQFAISHGLAFEALYTKAVKGRAQVLSPSLVFGNGTFGLGAFGSRTGTSLSDTAASVDSAGVGGGLALIKERLTIGGEYYNSIDSGAGKGTILGSITLNGPQRKGPSIGIGFMTTTASGATRSGIAAVGYRFMSGFSLEGAFNANNLNDFENFVASAAATMASQVLYLGLGSTWANTTKNVTASARLGACLGRFLDLSAMYTHPFYSAGVGSWGASLRATF